MLFCILGTDKPNSLDLRLANRDKHLKYWSDAGCIRISGPFTSDDGTVMNGSLLVIEVDSRAIAEDLTQNDPYQLAGLFDTVEIRAWKWLLGPKP